MKQIFLILVFSSLTFLLYSQKQEQTVYQKKIYAIKVQVCKAYGVSPSMVIDSKGKLDMGQLGLINKRYGNISRQQEMDILFGYMALVKQAEKYKTEVDFKREREERERDEYNNSDYVHLKDSVKFNFAEWLRKGEFEKSSDYENRMQSAQENFEKIILEQIYSLNNKQLGNNNYNNKLDINLLLHKTLMPYNADKESFNISFEYKGFKWSDNISIPIYEAETFKKEFNKYKMTISDNDDWRIMNNLWYPKFLFMKDFDNEATGWRFEVPLKNETNINFTASQLGFNQPFLKNVNFNYNNYLEKIKKQQAIDEESRRVEDSIYEVNRRTEDSLSEVKRKEDSLLTDQRQKQYELIAEKARIQDSIISERKRKENEILIQKQRIQDSILDANVKREKELADIQEKKDYDTLYDLIQQHNLSQEKISERYNIKEETKRKVNNNNNDDLVKLSINLIASSSNELNEKKRFIFERYVGISKNYQRSASNASNSHGKIPYFRKLIMIDNNLLSLKSNREIKEMAKKLEPLISNQDIENVLIVHFK